MRRDRLTEPIAIQSFGAQVPRIRKTQRDCCLSEKQIQNNLCEESHERQVVTRI